MDVHVQCIMLQISGGVQWVTRQLCAKPSRIAGDHHRAFGSFYFEFHLFISSSLYLFDIYTLSLQDIHLAPATFGLIEFVLSSARAQRKVMPGTSLCSCGYSPPTRQQPRLLSQYQQHLDIKPSLLLHCRLPDLLADNLDQPPGLKSAIHCPDVSHGPQNCECE